MDATQTQADKVIGKFGSACRLAKLLGCEDSTVYRWTYPRANGGSDGMVPPKALRKILELASKQVPPIVITPTDLYPTGAGASK